MKLPFLPIPFYEINFSPFVSRSILLFIVLKAYFTPIKIKTRFKTRLGLYLPDSKLFFIS